MIAFGLHPDHIRRETCPTCQKETEYLQEDVTFRFILGKDSTREVIRILRCSTPTCRHDIIVPGLTLLGA